MLKKVLIGFLRLLLGGDREERSSNASNLTRSSPLFWIWVIISLDALPTLPNLENTANFHKAQDRLNMSIRVDGRPTRPTHVDS